MSDRCREALRELVRVLRERHHGRMPEEVERAYYEARAALSAPDGCVASLPREKGGSRWTAFLTERSNDMKQDRLTASPAVFAALARGDVHNALAAATPGGIEAQEKAGQATFIHSETLPKEMLHGCTREKLEAIGIQFGPDSDDLFVNVKLPAGWKKVATNHSMWSDLVDDKGRKRAGIFYKAAFYDRNAHISLNRRYTIDAYDSCDSAGKPAEYPSSHSKVVIKDCGAVLREVGIYPDRDYKALDELEAQALSWLAENFPQHNEPTAYWD